MILQDVFSDSVGPSKEIRVDSSSNWREGAVFLQAGSEVRIWMYVKIVCYSELEKMAALKCGLFGWIMQ